MGVLSSALLFLACFAFTEAFMEPRDEWRLDPPSELSKGLKANGSLGVWSRPWIKYGNRTFLFVAKPEQWVQAQLLCIECGGTLASVHSGTEYQFLQKLTNSSTTSGAWIGGFDSIKEGTWLWIDGTPFDFSQWNPGEPNNNSNDEGCVCINRSGRGWNDLRCEASLPFVCAKRL